MSKLFKLALSVVLVCLALGQFRSHIAHADQSLATGTWQKLVGQVKTLRVKSTLTLYGYTAPINNSAASDFVIAPNRYRVDTAYHNFGPNSFSKVTLSYDGKLYYERQVSDRVSLQRYRIREQPEPYNLANPYSVAFGFVFTSEQKRFMSELADPISWKNLASRISKREHVVVNGTAGTMLTINSFPGKNSPSHYNVFVDDTIGLPVSWQEVDDQMNLPSREMTITWKKAAVEPSGSIMMPADIVFTIHGQLKGKTMTGGYRLHFETASAKVNTPVLDEGFTLPATQADEVLGDVN